MRAARKVQKYAPLAAAVSSQFRPAVLERFGACCEGLAGLVRLLCGERDRDALRCEDYVFSTRSRSTYMAGLLTLAAVAADAAMVEHVVSVDARGVPEARYDARGRGPRVGCHGPPPRRDVEGMGGVFWYEGRL